LKRSWLAPPALGIRSVRQPSITTATINGYRYGGWRLLRCGARWQTHRTAELRGALHVSWRRARCGRSRQAAAPRRRLRRQSPAQVPPRRPTASGARAAEPPAEKPPGVIDGFAGSYTTVLTLDHREDLPSLSRRPTASPGRFLVAWPHASQPCPQRALSNSPQRLPTVTTGQRAKSLTCATAGQRAAQQCFPSSR
jgi:hypothetical protein